jgi:hypothetical protein
MNHNDTPASEPRVVERHSLLVEITIDELGRIGYAITPDRDVQDTHGVTFLELARRGAPISRVAMAMLVHELDRRLLVEILERTEMRFRRAGRWEEALRAGNRVRDLSPATAGPEDPVH